MRYSRAAHASRPLLKLLPDGRHLLAALSLALLAPAGAAQFLSPRPAPQPVVIPSLQPPLPEYVFPDRQTLTFAVDWRVFPAATAVFHLEREGNTEKVTASADTLGAITMLFPVVDRFQASLDTRTGCSGGFSKQLLEGHRRVTGDLSFNYQQGRQTLVEKNLVKGTSKTQTASIPACVTDSLSAIFYAASQPLVVGQPVRFPLADSMRTVTVAMKVEAREEVKVPAGTFQTIRVQPTADEGIVKNRGNIWIWYTDDARHMPVQIQARLFFGTITARLQSYEAK
ncbi:MAG: DUF3108 domain-containing protein [Acidobacteriota bacterium]|nr:DUF3108 domain-containing protein [Acidobacteriota bacterium]